MSAGSMIAARQKKYVRAFLNGTAIDEETAKSLEELQCGDGVVFRMLVKREILLSTEDGRWYIDQLAWTRYLEKRRVFALGVVLVLLVGLLLAVASKFLG